MVGVDSLFLDSFSGTRLLTGLPVAAAAADEEGVASAPKKFNEPPPSPASMHTGVSSEESSEGPMVILGSSQSQPPYP